MKPGKRTSGPGGEAGLERSLEEIREAMPALDAGEPPELLDRAVLNAARRELSNPASRHPLRWLGAFASATVIVLALALVIRQEQDSATVAPPPVLLEQDGIGLEQMAEPEARSSRPASSVKAVPSPEPVEKSADFAAEAPPASGATAMARDPEEEAALQEAKEAAGDIPDPEEWVDRLLLLHRSGLYEQLEGELAEFRSAYPDYPLPPALQD